MSSAERHREQSENPLAGDVDRWVNPDETRSDEQITRDENIANRLHMSGTDDSDAYWEEYDELYGDAEVDEDTEDQQVDPDEDDDEFGEMIMSNIAKNRRQRGYDPELDGDEEDEDPLAGDVDRWVHPDETNDR